jgi:TP901-1 family phage major tail protein
MTANAGRSVTFLWDGAPIQGVREKTFAFAGEPIDVTSDDDAGWRKLLPIAGQNEANYSLGGLLKDTRLEEAYHSGNRTAVVVVGYPNGATITGEFMIASYQPGATYNDAVSFSAELQSTGAVVYLAGATPTNTLLPAIIGTPQVGVALNSYRGEWTGAPTSFAYQWQELISSTWTNISGATAATYTPVVGSVGRPLRVIVTATNSAGSASATSGPSADILAA